MIDQFIHLRQKPRDAFELRYKGTIDAEKNRWELCSRVWARKDVIEELSEAWVPEQGPRSFGNSFPKKPRN